MRRRRVLCDFEDQFTEQWSSWVRFYVAIIELTLRTRTPSLTLNTRTPGMTLRSGRPTLTLPTRD